MGVSVEQYKQMIAKTNGVNVKKQLVGKKINSLGKNFEFQIENICRIYEEKKLAKIEKTPEPVKVLQHIDNGHFDAIFTKAAQPDFKGTLKGGRTVVFDAKFTKEKIFCNMMN